MRAAVNWKKSLVGISRVHVGTNKKRDQEPPKNPKSKKNKQKKFTAAALQKLLRDDSRPAILGIVRFAIRDSVPLRSEDSLEGSLVQLRRLSEYGSVLLS